MPMQGAEFPLYTGNDGEVRVVDKHLVNPLSDFNAKDMIWGLFTHLQLRYSFVLIVAMIFT